MAIVRLIIIILILALGWGIYAGKIDIAGIMNNSEQALKNEKTIKAINSSRDRTQNEIREINNQ